MDDWQGRRKRRNLALALTLVALTVIFYAISFVKMRDLENRRHRENPQAHGFSNAMP